MNEVSVDRTKLPRVDAALHRLKALVDGIEATKPMDLPRARSYLAGRGVALPFDYVSDAASVQWKLQYLPPTAVHVVGSYLLQTTARPVLNVDVALEMPAVRTARDAGHPAPPRRAADAQGAGRACPCPLCRRRCSSPRTTSTTGTTTSGRSTSPSWRARCGPTRSLRPCGGRACTATSASPCWCCRAPAGPSPIPTRPRTTFTRAALSCASLPWRRCGRSSRPRGCCPTAMASVRTCRTTRRVGHQAPTGSPP